MKGPSVLSARLTTDVVLPAACLNVRFGQKPINFGHSEPRPVCLHRQGLDPRGRLSRRDCSSDFAAWKVAEFERAAIGPAPKGAPKGGGVTKAQGGRNFFNC